MGGGTSPAAVRQHADAAVGGGRLLHPPVGEVVEAHVGLLAVRQRRVERWRLAAGAAALQAVHSRWARHRRHQRWRQARRRHRVLAAELLQPRRQVEASLVRGRQGPEVQAAPMRCAKLRRARARAAVPVERRCGRWCRREGAQRGDGGDALGGGAGRRGARWQNRPGEAGWRAWPKPCVDLRKFRTCPSLSIARAVASASYPPSIEAHRQPHCSSVPAAGLRKCRPRPGSVCTPRSGTSLEPPRVTITLPMSWSAARPSVLNGEV